MRAENRRQQILDTAERLFIAAGFEGVTMGEIAAALGVSRPTIYSYFASTAAILDALLEAGLGRLWQRLEPIVAAEHARAVAARAAGEPFEPQLPLAIFRLLLAERGLLAVARSGGSAAFHRRRRALVYQGLAPLLAPYLPPGHDDFTIVILIELWESMAFWAITEEVTEIEPLAASMARFMHGGLEGAAGSRPQATNPVP